MASTIKLKRGSGEPGAGALVEGEPAFDLTNKRLYTENTGGTVIEVGTNPTTLQVDGTLTVGVDDTGYDVKFFGATSGKSMLWDQSADSLIVEGNVGIGTTTPGYTLDVENATDNGIARFTSGDADVFIVLADSGTTGAGNRIGAISDDMYFKTASTTRMTIDSSGRVIFGDPDGDISGLVFTGLATTDPVINTNATGAEFVAYRTDNAVNDGDFIGAYLFGNDDNDATEDHFAGMWAKAIGTAGSMNLHFAAGKAGYEADSPQMTFSSAGNLGIGTTAPALDLHVVGADGVGEGVPSFNADSIAVFQNSGSAGDAAIVHIISGTTGNAFLAFGDKDDSIRQTITANQADGDLKFATGNSALAMTITSGGDVSIPTGDLTIGSGQADGVILELSNTDSVSNGLQIQLSGNGKDVYFWNHEDAAIGFATNNTQRMTIDSSGNVLIGHDTYGTAVDNGSTGVTLGADGRLTASRANTVARFNLEDGDGEIIDLMKDGGVVGKIGTNSSAPYFATAVGSTLCGIKAQGGSTPRISPTDGDGAVSNGVTNLGATDARWKDLFIGNDIGHLDNGGTARLLYDKSGNLLGNTGTNVTCATLSKSSGSFKIDHPLESKTDTHHLIHSFVESPTADNIYRGKIALVLGSATVNIDTAAGMTDGTFAALNREVQCFTSNESGWTAVKGSVSGNTLTITAQEDTCTDTVSWLVVGERKDPHMYATDWTDENGKVIVEPLKPVIEETEEETP